MLAVIQDDPLLEEEDGDVVVQASGVVVGMDPDGLDDELPVLLVLLGRLAAGVVLNDTHLQQAVETHKKVKVTSSCTTCQIG